jgi:hypothetical protein
MEFAAQYRIFYGVWQYEKQAGPEFINNNRHGCVLSLICHRMRQKVFPAEKVFS